MIPTNEEPAERSEDILVKAGIDFDVSSKIAVRLLAVCLIGLLLHYLSLVAIPMVFAILICLLQFPIIRFLAERRLPVAVGLFAAEILVFGPLLAFGYLLVSSLGPLVKQLPFYQERLLKLSSEGLTYVLNAVGQDGGDIALRKEIVDNVLRGVLQEGVEIVESSLGAVTSAIGGLSLTVVFSVFILLEATRWREKFSDAFTETHPLLLSMSTIGQDVRRYVLAELVEYFDRRIGMALSRRSRSGFCDFMGTDCAAVKFYSNGRCHHCVGSPDIDCDCRSEFRLGKCRRCRGGAGGYQWARRHAT